MTIFLAISISDACYIILVPVIMECIWNIISNSSISHIGTGYVITIPFQILSPAYYSIRCFSHRCPISI